MTACRGLRCSAQSLQRRSDPSADQLRAWSAGAAALAAAFVLHASPAMAESLTGTAKVIDGDTLEVAGTRIRLYGVDAPESKQLCKRRNGQEYSCGTHLPAGVSTSVESRMRSCSSPALLVIEHTARVPHILLMRASSGEAAPPYHRQFPPQTPLIEWLLVLAQAGKEVGRHLHV